MSVTPTIDQLRKDIDSARNDLIRIESQQESAQEELEKLEKEQADLGFAGKNLSAEANRITEDVHEAVEGVETEMQALVKETERE